MFAKYPSVSVTRTRAHFPHLLSSTVGAGKVSTAQEAFVATGVGARGIATSSATSSATTTTHDPNFAAPAAPPLPQTEPPSAATTTAHPRPISLSTAFIGLGTNLGSRPQNLNDAVTRLDHALRQQHEEGGRVVETSFMYESEAMYHEEQDKFLNAAVKVRSPSPSFIS